MKLKEYIEEYGFGECHSLAIAISREYDNCDIYAIYEKGFDQVLLHAFAVKDNMAIDAHGVNSIDYIQKLYNKHTYKKNIGTYIEKYSNIAGFAEKKLFHFSGGYDEECISKALNDFNYIKNNTEHYKKLTHKKILLFHGTTDKINKFSQQKGNKMNGNDPNSAFGIHFSDSPEYASEYALLKETLNKTIGKKAEPIVYVVDYFYKNEDSIYSNEDFYGIEEEKTNNHKHFENLKNEYLEKETDLIHFEGGEEPISVALKPENLSIKQTITVEQAKTLEKIFSSQNIDFDNYEKRIEILNKLQNINYDPILIDYEDVASLQEKQFIDDAEILAKKENIGILSTKKLTYIICDNNNTVIGAAWTEFEKSNSEYSFDIVVDSKYQGFNIGNVLLDEVIDIPEEYKDYDPETKHSIVVSSEKMKGMLEKRGFEIKEQYFGNWVMNKKNKKRNKYGFK